MKKFFAIVCLFMVTFTNCCFAEEVTQLKISYMEGWPTLPSPYYVRDWNETARQVTLLSLDAEAKYTYFPVSTYFEQKEQTSGGYSGLNYGTHTYLKENNQMSSYGEAVTQLSAIVTAALTDGIDPRNINGLDYVQMAQAYYSCTPDGRGFVSNGAATDDCSNSFWYTLYPTILYCNLASLYSDDAVLNEHLRSIAETWLEASTYIDDWDSMGVSLKNRQVIKGNHTEPEGIIGAAYVLMTAYNRFNEQRYMEAALRLMQVAASRKTNPYYEILGSYAPYIAARMNAEQNAGLPLERMLDWVFCDGTDSARGGWGIINSKWGDYDAYGLSGSIADTKGYAFAMNTFVTAGALAPVARYAPQYSRALGQYLTAVASNANMFIGDGLPPEMQDDSAYVQETGIGYLVYEGVRNEGKTTPFATGDAKNAQNPSGTNFSFYSSGPIGLFSSIVSKTSVPEILCFDLLKTDFERQAAYPTYLIYNPLEEEKSVTLTFSKMDGRRVYDVISGKIIGTIENEEIAFSMLPDTAIQVVILPENGDLVIKNGRTMLNDIVVSYETDYVEISEITENLMVKEDIILKPNIHLQPNDTVASYTLLYDGVALTNGESMPSEIIFDISKVKAGRGTLEFKLTTQKGRVLSWAQGIKIYPENAEVLMHYNAQQMFETLRPKQNCKTELVEQGFKMRLLRDWACFSLPYVELKADDHPMLIIDVPYSWGGWGVLALIGDESHYIQGDCAAQGQMMYDLGDLMNQWGVTEGKIVIQPFITAGAGSEVIISDIVIVKAR